MPGDIPKRGRMEVTHPPLRQTRRPGPHWEEGGFGPATTPTPPRDPDYTRFRQMWKTDVFQFVYGATPQELLIPSFEEWLVQKLAASETALPLSKSELEQAIGYDPIHASWTDSTGSHGVVTHMAAKDRDLIVNKILKAQEKKHG